jgi:Lar family restriction alleviation protein
MDTVIMMWNNSNVVTEEDFKASQQSLLDGKCLVPKPCPFCGVDPNVHHYKSEDVFPSGYTDDPYSCEIECPECDYVGAEGSGMTEREAFKDALDKWNRRAEQ